MALARVAFVLALLAALAPVGGDVLAAAPASGTWTPTGQLPTGYSQHPAARLDDGRVLVTGGTAAGSGGAAAAIYAPATDTWSATGNTGTARGFATLTPLANGRALLVGGLVCRPVSGCTILATAEVYEPATGTWRSTGDMAQSRYTPTATRLTDGRVLVVGGNSSNGGAGTAEIYDPLTGAWSATGTLNQWRSMHTATLLRDGTVLIVGGHAGCNMYACPSLAAAERYNPVTNAWVAVAPMGTPRKIHTATLLDDGTVLVAGGQDDCPNGGNCHALASAEIYDPGANVWHPTGAMALARNGSGEYFTATLLSDGTVLAAGSSPFINGAWVDQRSAERYDPASGTWHQATPLTVGRSEHTATLLLDGRVLVAGGGGTDAARRSAERYDPNGTPVTPDTTAPVLALPSPITVAATSPAGAPVTYTATASDLVDGALTVACTPASGATFPIGTTTVACSATDKAGNTASGSFAVTIKGAAGQLADLGALLSSFKLQKGAGNGLTPKLQTAQTALAAGNVAGACDALTAFANETRAQNGKALTAAQAMQLLAEVARIRATLSCG